MSLLRVRDLSRFRWHAMAFVTFRMHNGGLASACVRYLNFLTEFELTDSHSAMAMRGSQRYRHYHHSVAIPSVQKPIESRIMFPDH